MPTAPPSTASVRAVFFDAGNTLFYESPSRFAIYTDAARDLGLQVTAAEMRAAMHRAHERVPPVEGETARYTERWFRAYVPEVYQSIGATPSMMDGFLEHLMDRYRKRVSLVLFPETERVLSALRSRGLHLGIISNWSARLSKHLDRLNLTNSFDTILISAVEGIEKPEPAIFLRACERAGVRPDEALHVGDHPVNDAEGARRAGLKPLLVRRPEEVITIPDRLQNITIQSLEDVLLHLDVHP